MTYGLPDSFIVGATKRLGSAITTKRQNRKSATSEWLDELEWWSLYRDLGRLITKLSYLGWWKRYKPQTEESPKSQVRFTDSFDI
jgi:hypothetical protein